MFSFKSIAEFLLDPDPWILVKPDPNPDPGDPDPDPQH